MACYFDKCQNLIMRRGDTATLTIESEDIPFENYDYAYFAIINLDTKAPVLPELKVATTSVRSITFTYTAVQTESLPQPTEPFDTYGYTFKLCTNAGVEDTFIPQAAECTQQGVVIKKIPKALVYPKVIEGEVPVPPNA